MEGAGADLPTFPGANGPTDPTAASDATEPSPVNETSWEREWTYEELRDAATDWNLASDYGLQTFLESLSKRILDNTMAVEAQVDSLVHHAKGAEVALHNTFNQFLMLANTQYIENRVYEQDFGEQKLEEEEPEKEMESSAPLSSEVDFAQLMPKYANAVALGLTVLESALEKARLEAVENGSNEEPVPEENSECNADFDEGEGNDGKSITNENHSESLDLDTPYQPPSKTEEEIRAEKETERLERQRLLKELDPYSRFPLPYIIGTEDFDRSDNCGIILEEEWEYNVKPVLGSDSEWGDDDEDKKVEEESDFTDDDGKVDMPADSIVDEAPTFKEEKIPDEKFNDEEEDKVVEDPFGQVTESRTSEGGIDDSDSEKDVGDGELPEEKPKSKSRYKKRKKHKTKKKSEKSEEQPEKSEKHVEGSNEKDADVESEEEEDGLFVESLFKGGEKKKKDIVNTDGLGDFFNDDSDTDLFGEPVKKKKPSSESVEQKRKHEKKKRKSSKSKKHRHNRKEKDSRDNASLLPDGEDKPKDWLDGDSQLDKAPVIKPKLGGLFDDEEDEDALMFPTPKATGTSEKLFENSSASVDRSLPKPGGLFDDFEDDEVPKTRAPVVSSLFADDDDDDDLLAQKPKPAASTEKASVEVIPEKKSLFAEEVENTGGSLHSVQITGSLFEGDDDEPTSFGSTAKQGVATKRDALFGDEDIEEASQESRQKQLTSERSQVSQGVPGSTRKHSATKKKDALFEDDDEEGFSQAPNTDSLFGDDEVSFASRKVTIKPPEPRNSLFGDIDTEEQVLERGPSNKKPSEKRSQVGRKTPTGTRKSGPSSKEKQSSLFVEDEVDSFASTSSAVSSNPNINTTQSKVAAGRIPPSTSPGKTTKVATLQAALNINPAAMVPGAVRKRSLTSQSAEPSSVSLGVSDQDQGTQSPGTGGRLTSLTRDRARRPSRRRPSRLRSDNVVKEESPNRTESITAAPPTKKESKINAPPKKKTSSSKGIFDDIDDRELFAAPPAQSKSVPKKTRTVPPKKKAGAGRGASIPRKAAPPKKKATTASSESIFEDDPLFGDSPKGKKTEAPKDLFESLF